MHPVVLITGSSHGIGLAAALHMAKHGYQVYATVRNLAQCTELRQAAEKLPSLVIKQLDVADKTSVQTAVKEILKETRHIDVLICNAGIGFYGPTETLKEKELKRLFNVNVLGTVRVVDAVVPSMRAHEQGCIILLGSISGISPSRNLPAYAMTKAAIESYAATNAEALAKWNIRIKLLLPGPVVTDFEPRTPFGSRFKEGENPYKQSVEKGRQNWKEMMDKGQSAEEVAVIMQKAVESHDDQRLWIPTSQYVYDVAAKHFKDPTGRVRIPNGPKL